MKKLMYFGALLIVIAGCKNNNSSETERFINGTYAILTEQNGGDYNLVGGHEHTPENATAIKDMLKQWWEINNLAQGNETVAKLTGPGLHNPDFIKEIKAAGIDKMSKAQFEEALTKVQNPDDKAYFNLLYKSYKEFGENALVGWDLGRANLLITSFYVADFYDQETALDKALEVSKKIQKTFKSWDEFNRSYMYGYEFWSGDKPGSPKYEEKMAAIKKLQEDDKSPMYVDWNTALKKDWSK